MDPWVRRGLVLAVVLALLGVAAPVLGWVTPETGRWLLVAAMGLVVAEVIYSARGRIRGAGASLAATLPVEFRSPVVRKHSAPPIEDAPAPLGFLDFEAVAVAAMQRMTKTLGAIARETVAMGKTFVRYTPRFEKAVSWSSEAKQALGREAGAKVEAHAQHMERLEVDLRQGIDEMATNYLERIRFAPGAAVGEVRPSIAGMRDATAASRPSTAGMRDAAINLRNQNVQQAMNRATDRLIDVLGRLISDFDAVTRFATTALTMIDEKIAAENAATGATGASARRSRRRAK